MTLSEPIQITRLVADVFERLHIPYLVGGSLASSLHGIPRATQDADMVADLKPIHKTSFIEALQTKFHIDEDMVERAIMNRSCFNLIHLETMFKVDVFVLKEDEASQEEMARRELYRISEEAGIELYLASAEDTIIRKLIWFQLGEEVSERQWNDVLGVIRIQGEKLDLAYLQKWGHSLGVTDLLHKAFKSIAS